MSGKLAGRALVGWLIVVPLSLAPAVEPATAAEAPRGSPVLGSSDFRVSSGTEWAERPAVAWNTIDEEYLVVWSDFRAPGGYSDIYGRRVAADGTLMGAADFRISSTGATSDETYPAVVWNTTARQYLVVWIDWRNGSYADIYGRRLKADGTPLGADFRISVSAPRDEGIPDVVWNATRNQYLVVWADTRSAKADIYGQRVGANGSLIGGEIRVSGAGATNDELSPAVTWNATGNQYLVVWEDLRTITRWHIYGRRIGAGGTPVGEDFRISGDTASYSEARPDVAWNSATNQFLVVWEDYRGEAHLADLYGRRVRANGMVVGDVDVRLSGTKATSNEIRPAVVWNETSQDFLLIWEDQRDGPDRDWDVYGRKVRSGGLPSGADFRICGEGATDKDLGPALAWNGVANQYLVVWEDDRGATGAIYGRQVAG